MTPIGTTRLSDPRSRRRGLVAGPGRPDGLRRRAAAAHGPARLARPGLRQGRDPGVRPIGDGPPLAAQLNASREQWTVVVDRVEDNTRDNLFQGDYNIFLQRLQTNLAPGPRRIAPIENRSRFRDVREREMEDEGVEGLRPRRAPSTPITRCTPRPWTCRAAGRPTTTSSSTWWTSGAGGSSGPATTRCASVAIEGVPWQASTWPPACAFVRASWPAAARRCATAAAPRWTSSTWCG